MQKLINTIQHYAWGSRHALPQLYGIANPDNLPMAELWLGAHPKSSSQVCTPQGERQSLRALIEADKTAMLGATVAHRFGELPFLFKVLCAELPLSIQVHPDKTAAEQGYARENACHIPLDAPQRNYKDANHKPELVYAISPFLAMNGFCELAQIASQLLPVADAHTSVQQFIDHPDPQRLRTLFGFLLRMSGEEKAHAMRCLARELGHQQGENWQAIRFIAQHFPNDNALFAPLLLNIITLQPGQAMFLTAQTPHAYLHGVALEVMANSDNVLRAGLTPKHIDIDELLASVAFISKPRATLLTPPQHPLAAQPASSSSAASPDETRFPVPVDDFAFSLYQLTPQGCQLTPPGASILLCLQGDAQLDDGNTSLTLTPGESVFIPASSPPVQARGTAQLAQACCPQHKTTVG